MQRKMICLMLALLLMLFSAALAEGAGKWSCPSCGTENAENFCTNCGAARPRNSVCPSCGREFAPGTDYRFCPGCGANLTEAEADKEATAPEAPAAFVSLWGKTVTPELLELPGEAYARADSRLVGISADGSRALITTPGGPHYVWVAETGERIPLHFAPETAAVVRQRILSPYLTAAEYTALEDKIYALGETELVELWLSVRLEDGNGFLGACALVDGDYVGAVDRTGGGVLVVDMRDGTASGWLGDGNESIADGRALRWTMPALVEWLDLRTGAASPAGFDFHSDELPFEDYAIKVVKLLDDGGVCAILRDSQLDKVNGEECAFVLRRADGTLETYGLGRIRFGWEPDTIFAVPGSNCFVLSSRMLAATTIPYLISGGEVSLLTLGESGFVRMPLKGLLDENDILVAPESMTWLPVAEMADGETLLALDGPGGIAGLALLRPDTLAYQTVVTPEQSQALGLNWLIGLGILSGNGVDVFHSRQAYLGDNPRTYLHLSVK